MTKAQKTERDEAIAQLREWIKPGDTVYTVLEHVSRSGMQREIRVVIPYQTEDGRIDHLHPNYSVSKALGLRQGKRDGLIMGGCGMDMGFALVYELSHALYGHGYACLGKGENGRRRCPSNYHSNHHDTVRCPEDACHWVRGQGYVTVAGDSTGSRVICPTCKGEGRIANPEGPERWDLVHTDGYAVRQQWL